MPTYDAAQIGGLAADAAGMRVELKGRAAAPDGGPLTSPLTSTPCVWYRTRTSVRTRETTRDSEGRSRTSEQERTLSQEASEVAFALADDTGTVAVDPRGANIDQPRQVADRFERSQSGVTVNLGPVTLRGDGDVLGYRHQEWVIREGDPLYVLAGAWGDPARGEVRAPRTGEYLISLRSEEELVSSAGRWSTGFAIAGAVLAVAAVALAVAGIIG